MARPARRFHLDIDPPVTGHLESRSIRFVGLSFLRDVVMVEYEVDPPFRKQESAGFWDQYLLIDVTDDTGPFLYPTSWPDFEWPWISEGRTTTRLDKRPPAEATRLHVVVHACDAKAATETMKRTRLGFVAEFDVTLPPDHDKASPPTTHQ